MEGVWEMSPAAPRGGTDLLPQAAPAVPAAQAPTISAASEEAVGVARKTFLAVMVMVEAGVEAGDSLVLPAAPAAALVVAPEEAVDLEEVEAVAAWEAEEEVTAALEEMVEMAASGAAVAAAGPPVEKMPADQVAAVAVMVASGVAVAQEASAFPVEGSLVNLALGAVSDRT